MVTYNGEHCVIVSQVDAYRVEIHTHNGAQRVYWSALRETEPGEIRRQKALARDGRADNSELWIEGPMP